MSKRIVVSLLFFLSVLTLCAAPASKYVGRTETDVLGKHESRANLVLVVEGNGPEYTAHLEGFEILGYKGISIKGKVTLSADGKIISFKDVTISGAPAKVKSLSGTMTAKGADLVLQGKAAGMFPFKVHYVAQ